VTDSRRHNSRRSLWDTERWETLESRIVSLGLGVTRIEFESQSAAITMDALPGADVEGGKWFHDHVSNAGQAPVDGVVVNLPGTSRKVRCNLLRRVATMEDSQPAPIGVLGVTAAMVLLSADEADLVELTEALVGGGEPGEDGAGGAAHRLASAPPPAAPSRSTRSTRSTRARFGSGTAAATMSWDRTDQLPRSAGSGRRAVRTNGGAWGDDACGRYRPCACGVDGG
jgi:hypothetical protein